MDKVLHSSVAMDWCTPGVVLDLVRQVGPIGLDPCTSEDNPVGASTIHTPATNGLVHGWGGYGLVYANPPYGRALAPWAAKFAREGNALGVELICLVPSRTDTRWWAHIMTAAAICLWRGRIRFVGAKASAPFPSALGYWGPRADRFAEVFAPRGWIVRP